MTAYQKLATKLETITQLSRASAVLGYDQLVFMPSPAAAERGAQLGALASVIHEKQTDPELLQLMDQALQELDGTKKDTLRLLELERKVFLGNERIPAAL
jgi:carboxypeptidase Taq